VPQDKKPTPWALITGGVLICGLLTLASWLTFTALRPASESYGAYHGMLTIDFSVSFNGRSGMADFMGTFHSDDGTLDVPNVAFTLKRVQGWVKWEERIPAWLEGPDDHEAMPDDGASADRFVRGTIAVALVAWAIAQSVWWVRHRRREAAGHGDLSPRSPTA
jgi:hypothetical protein